MAHGATEGELEVKDNRLAPCPSSPKCVCTQGDSENHTIAPYRYRKTLEGAKAVLKQVCSELSHTELVKEEDVYLHCEVTSLVVRFVDDVEILFDDTSKIIHFRSAVRMATTILALTGDEWTRFEGCWRANSSHV